MAHCIKPLFFEKAQIKDKADFINSTGKNYWLVHFLTLLWHPEAAGASQDVGPDADDVGGGLDEVVGASRTTETATASSEAPTTSSAESGA